MILKFAMGYSACMDCLICNSTYEVCNKMYSFSPQIFFSARIHLSYFLLFSPFLP